MDPANIRILIAEDEPSLRTILKNMFLKKGWEVETVMQGDHAITKIRTQTFDVALVDIRMPERSGFEVLAAARNDRPELPMIIMTAQDTMKNAVEAMKRGAFDYITKPFELDELEVIIDRALETNRLSTEVIHLRQEVQAKKFDRQAKLIGQSKPVREIYKVIGKVAASDVPVLITGESGTGKELVAKSIHQASSRADRPFIAVNCAAIPKDLLESELFGYRKGAFTGAEESRSGYFEAANKGTLFLDEIGDMALSLQSKLLRVLQEKEISRLGSPTTIPIDVRILSATNQDLAAMAAQKKFREDLLFRLNVVPLQIPPLRERQGDVEVLVQYFIEKFSAELNLPPKTLSEDALQLLKEYAWPGNVRELENMVKRSMVLVPGGIIRANDLSPLLQEAPLALTMEALEALSLEDLIEKKLSRFLEKLDCKEELDLYAKILPMVERPLLSLVLKKTRGNQIQAARALGINRNTLRKMIKTLRISRFAHEGEDE